MTPSRQSGLDAKRIDLERSEEAPDSQRRTLYTLAQHGLAGTRFVTSDSIAREKRLRFRCWHRGTKELDLLLGGFADRHLAELSPDQLDRFEALLDLPEPVLYNWITGQEPPDAPYDHDVMTLLRDFKIKPLAD